MKKIEESSHLNESDVSPNVDAPQRRGFARLSPEHQFTSDEARIAGKKGGVAPHVRRGRHAVSEVAK